MIDTANKRVAVPIATRVLPKLTPLNDPNVWAMSPAYYQPKDVDVAYWQKEIDSVIGTTRGNQSIVKLVWNGDRNFWREYFMKWNALGQPIETPFKRPIVRYKALRKPNGELVRDVFPPRWLLLARLEPEQFADNWEKEAFIFAPEIGAYKQIKPEIAPPVYWLWYATVAEHNGYCCTKAEKENTRCYGTYAPPSAKYLELLGEQKRAAEASGIVKNPFKKISADFISQSDEEFTGYRAELARMEIESEIFVDNPMALIGMLPQIKEGISPSAAKQIVSDHFKKEMDETARLIK